MGFRGVDYYGIDELLSEEELLVRGNIRSFVDAEIMPRIGKLFRDGVFPMDLAKKLGNMGVLGAHLKGYGCAGLGAIAYGIILQELERGDSGIRSFASVQGSLSMTPIYEYGTEAQKQKWLPRMAAGDAIGCFALSEPDFGSNPAGMLATATKTQSGYRINGTKRWITNGSIADIAVVWVRLDGRVRGFLVEKGTKGFSAHDIPGKFSLRASVTSELVFEDAEVPEDALLPGGIGIKGPLSILSNARFGISWGAIGAAMACYEEALEYAKTRTQFKKPIAGYQLVQQKLVQMLSEITKAQLVAFRLGKLKEAGKATTQQISLAKRNNVFWAREIARMARDILGANGITDEYQCGRHMCNLESVYTYEGTHDVHTLILGQDITGIAAFE